MCVCVHINKSNAQSFQKIRMFSTILYINSTEDTSYSVVSLYRLL